ncbi:MAG TPA: type II toxin-antitoxin system RelE/ParE family toxin [Candidatus Ozemobacteraceae bacterium]
MGLVWEVIFWRDEQGNCPVEEWFAGLPPVYRKRWAKLFGYLESLGNELRMPHSRHIAQNLHELRDTGKGPGYRVYYCFHGRRVILLLIPGDKTTQTRDIRNALKIVEELGHEK